MVSKVTCKKYFNMKVPFGQILRGKVGLRNQRKVAGKTTAKPYFEQGTGIVQVGSVSQSVGQCLHICMSLGVDVGRANMGLAKSLSQRRKALRTVIFSLKIAIKQMSVIHRQYLWLTLFSSISLFAAI